MAQSPDPPRQLMLRGWKMKVSGVGAETLLLWAVRMRSAIWGMAGPCKGRGLTSMVGGYHLRCLVLQHKARVITSAVNFKLRKDPGSHCITTLMDPSDAMWLWLLGRGSL